MAPTSRIKLSPKEYVSLCSEYDVQVHSIFRAPIPPTYYAVVRGKESSEVVSYMYFDPAREEWIMFAPEEATAEIEQAFA